MRAKNEIEKDILKKEKFVIDIEFTGLTRNKAGKIVADYLGGTIEEAHDHYDSKIIKAPDGRKWKVMYAGPLSCQTKINGEVVSAGRKFSCALVSPVLAYDKDISTLQELVRAFRKSGGFTNDSCGIHVSLNGIYYDVKKGGNSDDPRVIEVGEGVKKALEELGWIK